jgi:hypothetical protein
MWSGLTKREIRRTKESIGRIMKIEREAEKLRTMAESMLC